MELFGPCLCSIFVGSVPCCKAVCICEVAASNSSSSTVFQLLYFDEVEELKRTNFETDFQ